MIRDSALLYTEPLEGLDLAVMEHLWRRGRSLGRVVAKALPGTPYTTVMSALQRLSERGLTAREKRGPSWAYWAVLTREDWEAHIADAAATRLLREAPGSALAAFVRTAVSLDERNLARLEQLIAAHRKPRG